MRKYLIAIIVAILTVAGINLPASVLEGIVSRVIPEAQAHNMIQAHHWELLPYDSRIDWCRKLALEDFRVNGMAFQRCVKHPNVKLATGEALRPSTPHSSGDLVEQSTSVQS